MHESESREACWQKSDKLSQSASVKALIEPTEQSVSNKLLAEPSFISLSTFDLVSRKPVSSWMVALINFKLIVKAEPGNQTEVSWVNN